MVLQTVLADLVLWVFVEGDSPSLYVTCLGRISDKLDNLSSILQINGKDERSGQVELTDGWEVE